MNLHGGIYCLRIGAFELMLQMYAMDDHLYFASYMYFEIIICT